MFTKEKIKGLPSVLGSPEIPGRDEGIRTLGFYFANAMLSQMPLSSK